jgi:hypothetical protein
VEHIVRSHALAVSAIYRESIKLCPGRHVPILLPGGFREDSPTHGCTEHHDSPIGQAWELPSSQCVPSRDCRVHHYRWRKIEWRTRPSSSLSCAYCYCYSWRKAYGGMAVNEVEQQKDLEKDNASDYDPVEFSVFCMAGEGYRVGTPPYPSVILLLCRHLADAMPRMRKLQVWVPSTRALAMVGEASARIEPCG